jgi:hypothetical protein
MRKVRHVKLRYRKRNGLRLRLIAERITGKPERTQLARVADQAIPGLPLSQTSDGNCVASEVVPCVFLAGPASSAPHNAERYRNPLRAVWKFRDRQAFHDLYECGSARWK